MNTADATTSIKASLRHGLHHYDADIRKNLEACLRVLGAKAVSQIGNRWPIFIVMWAEVPPQAVAYCAIYYNGQVLTGYDIKVFLEKRWQSSEAVFDFISVAVKRAAEEKNSDGRDTAMPVMTRAEADEMRAPPTSAGRYQPSLN